MKIAQNAKIYLVLFFVQKTYEIDPQARPWALELLNQL